MTWQTIIGAMIGGTVTALLLVAWAHLYRWRHRDEEQRMPLAVLSRRFRWWEVLGVVLMLAAMLASWVVLVWYANAYPRHPRALHWLGPGGWHWAIAAFCAGNLLATGPTHLLFQWWMGPAKYAEFRAYQTRKFGYDAHRFLPIFYAVFGVITAKLLVLLFSWGVAFTPDEIVIEPFWYHETHRYGYDQVLQIQVAPGSSGKRLRLQFEDGRWWSTAGSTYAASDDLIEAIAESVSRRSTLPVDRRATGG